MTRPFEVPVLRGVSRNIHIFDGRGNYLGGKIGYAIGFSLCQVANAETKHLGGYQNDPRSITAALFYEMCSHFLVFPDSHPWWSLFTLNPDNAFGQQVGRHRSYIEPGSYVVLGNRMYIYLTLLL